MNRDNAFFWEGVERGELLIQRCTACQRLRHPPGPACPACGSLEWDAVVASGRAELYSYVVSHYPQVPSFDYPYVVALVELEEGTRFVSNLVGVEPDEVRIGMPLSLTFVAVDPELLLPMFEPATR